VSAGDDFGYFCSNQNVTEANLVSNFSRRDTGQVPPSLVPACGARDGENFLSRVDGVSRSSGHMRREQKCSRNAVRRRIWPYTVVVGITIKPSLVLREDSVT